ncbi:GntR family transcriptional regulator [Nonomuraea sp. KM88]|uniref:GntR family transcriptional regulator n=1 Tax=Nonomuraea sp. KM88 TaxID=3457427 RepID=UPI003FCD89E2
MSIHPVTVADAVADQLRRRLLSGHYRGGDQLRDTELSQEFGVARPTVRAAVQTLVAEGLLDRGRGRSAQVRTFTAEDAIDLGRLRRPIETIAVEMIISRARPLAGIAAAARAFSALGDDVSCDVVAGHDVAFHRAVFVAAGSARLLRTFDELSAELRLLIAQLRPAYDSVSDLAREHELLLDALRSGDVQQARAAWNAHCDDSERFYLDLIQEHAR